MGVTCDKKTGLSTIKVKISNNKKYLPLGGFEPGMPAYKAVYITITPRYIF